MKMKYLHTMVRVTSLEDALDFYCNKLGLKEVRRYDVPEGRFTLVMLAAPGDEDCQVELTYNYDPEALEGGRNFGHLGLWCGKHLRVLPVAPGCGGDHQPPAARRPHGLRALARRHFDRAAPGGRGPAAARALGLDGKQRQLVVSRDRPKSLPFALVLGP